MDDKEITRLANRQAAATRINRDLYIEWDQTCEKKIILTCKEYPKKSLRFSKSELRYLTSLFNAHKSKKCKQQSDADGLS